MTRANPVMVFGFVLAATALIAANPLLTVLSGLALATIWWGVLANPMSTAFACMLTVQWLQASAKLWMANAFGVAFDEPSITWIGATSPLEVQAHTASATALALGGVVCVSLGARAVLPNIKLSPALFANFSPYKLLLLYLPLLGIAELSGPFVGGVLAQLISAIGFLRFVPVVLLVGLWFHLKRGGWVLAAIICGEVLLGFMSFFSQWKTILILTAVALVSVAGYSWRRIAPLLVVGFTGLILLATVWTIIKPEYRNSLSQGTRQQVILLTPAQQQAALSSELSDVSSDDLPRGLLDTLNRASYVDYLADVLRNVPTQIPFQGGALWSEALGQFLMPRILFPEKPPVPSDSERTMAFTGRHLASSAEGTSISIGYVGESYIDFGLTGALVIPFGIGLAFGSGIFALTRASKDHVIILPLAVAFIWSAQQFEMSNVKLVGSMAWLWVASFLFVLAWPHIKSFLLERKPSVPERMPSPLIR